MSYWLGIQMNTAAETFKIPDLICKTGVMLLWCFLVGRSTGTDVLAQTEKSYLSSIAHKVFALVTPNPLRCHYKHQDTKHKHHGQPDPPERSGVFIDSTQQTLQS